MSEMWGPVVGSLGFTALIVLPIIVNKIIKYKLEIARINADTTIRAEEIRARNQFEIERLVKMEHRVQETKQDYYENNELSNERTKVREKL